MKKTDDSVQSGAPDLAVTKIMLGTLASTSFRIFVPVLGLFGIGALIDFTFDFKPYGMIIGTAVGAVIAIVLVYLQIRSIKKGKK